MIVSMEEALQEHIVEYVGVLWEKNVLEMDNLIL